MYDMYDMCQAGFFFFRLLYIIYIMYIICRLPIGRTNAKPSCAFVARHCAPRTHVVSMSVPCYACALILRIPLIEYTSQALSLPPYQRRFVQFLLSYPTHSIGDPINQSLDHVWFFRCLTYALCKHLLHIPHMRFERQK